jgi:molybdopterin-guanine dinucleotide biosynthesis protein A
MTFSGAVLTGGASSRMGTDKAFLEVDGETLAGVAHRALVAAGACEVMAIGGDLERLRPLGFTVHPDSTPGEGPLGGILDALSAASSDIVVVLACDQPAIDAPLIRDLVRAMTEDDDAAVPVVDAVPQPLTAAYRKRALRALDEAFGAGERSPQRALAGLSWRAIEGVDARSIRDVDDLDDLARYASARQDPGTEPR